MVAIVSGNALGLSLGSKATLGQQGVLGDASAGRNGEQVYVNAATGNLVIQDLDENVVGVRQDLQAVRTYNSQGLLTDDNSDNWSNGIYRTQLILTGTRNADKSTLVRTDRDGAQSTYTWSTAAQKYISQDGDGAYDYITYDTNAAIYIRVDGSSGFKERYSGTSLQLISIIDPNNCAISYTYVGDKLTKVKNDIDGESISYVYSGSNLVEINTLNVAGATVTTRTRYEYDTSNRLTKVTVDLSPVDNVITDGKTYVTNYTYDGTSKRIASISQGDGTSLTFTYIQVGTTTTYKVDTIKDGLNNISRFTYNTTTRQTTLTDPLGLKTVYTYDAKGQLTQVAAPVVNGVTASTSFAYNASGDLVTVTDPVGQAVNCSYDANGNQTLQRDAAGNTVARTFNQNNQVLTENVYTVPDPDGAGTGQPSAPLTTRYVYDANNKNQLRFVISPEGRVVEHIYDIYGQRTSTLSYAASTYAVSGLALTAVPTEAQMATWVSSQDRTRLVRTDMAYDVRGQLQTTTSFATTNASGVGVANGTQSVTQYVYDRSGQLLQTISPINGSTVFTYDGLGRVLSSVDAKNVTTLNLYDDANRRTKITSSNGLTTTRTYDVGNRLVSLLQSSAAAATLGETKYFYDADNRLCMTQDPTGVRQWKLYDAAGRNIADVDGNGSLIEYIYNKNNQVTQTISYATSINVASMIDTQGLPTNPALASIRPVSSTGDRKTWRAYDTAGRLVKTVDASGSVTQTYYDGASRVIQTTGYANQISTTALTSTPTVASISPTSNVTQDRVARRFYDGDGQLLASLDGEGYLTELTYDSAGRQVQALRYDTVTAAANRATGTLSTLRPTTSPKDIRTVTLYDGENRVIATIDGENYLTETTYNTSGTISRQTRYATKLTGVIATNSSLSAIRPTSSPEDHVTAWSYDSLNRVNQEINAEGTITKYEYDDTGNLTSTTKAAGQGAERSVKARYDLQGRLTAELTGEGVAKLVAGLTQAQIDAIWSQYGVTHSYDAAGRRLSTTDQYNQKTIFYYDVDGHLTQTINAQGEVEEKKYNALGQLTNNKKYGTRISATGLTGGLITASVTTTLAAVADVRYDQNTSYTYNTDGTLATQTDARGFTTSISYNAFGNERSRTTVLGAGVNRTDSFDYDRRGLQTTTLTDSGALAITSRTDYDAFGRKINFIDGNGNTSGQKYDKNGRLVTATDGTLVSRSTTYDAFDRVLTQTDGLNQVTAYSYNTNDRSVTVTTPEGVTLKTVHTRFGQTFSVTDAKNRTTSYAYDLNGNQTGVTSPLTTQSQRYDNANRLVETTDARGVKVSYDYDSANRVLNRTVDPTGLNLVTSYAYDAFGQTVTVTDPRKVVTKTEYELTGEILRQTVDVGGLNLQTSYTHDGQGKTLTVTDPTNTVTQYIYDHLGRRTQEIIDPTGLNISRSYTYDKNGNVVTSTDGNQKVTRYTYDAEDRLQFTVDPMGGVVRNEYDAQGRIVRVTRYVQPISLTTLPTPATSAQVQALLAPTAGKDIVQVTRYDRDGRVHFIVDGTGAVTELKYDNTSRVSERITYANLINLSAWNITTDPVVSADVSRDAHNNTRYDELGRVTYTADAIGAVVRNIYDANGNIVQRVRYANKIALTAAPDSVTSSANDRVERYVYDSANREIWRVDGTGAVTQSVYDENGNVVRSIQYANKISANVLPSDVPASVVANATADRVTRFQYDKAGRRTYTADALNYVRGDQYDANGRIKVTTYYANTVAAGVALDAVIANTSKDRQDSFDYDRAGRLKNHIDALGSTESYTYDGVGHKLTFTNKKGSVWNYSYDAAGRLETETSPMVALASVSTDTAGNLVENQPVTAALVTKLTYDAQGNLTSRTEAFGLSEQRVTSYEYDAQGHQIKVSYPAVSVYTNETAAAVAANGQSGLATRAETAAQILTTRTYYDAFGNAVANVDVAGNVSFKAYDLAGRVSYEIDALGYVTGYARNAFGDAEAVTRYAVGTTLSNSIPSTASQAPTVATVAAVINGSSIAHTADRVLQNTYDQKGRVVKVVEATVYTYDSSSGKEIIGTGKTTCNQYNAFGELILSSILNGNPKKPDGSDVTPLSVTSVANDAVWINSYSYFDKVGHQVASINALGYLTTFEYDVVGNRTSSTEYANQCTEGSWSLTGYAPPAAAGNSNAAGADRVTIWTYDLGNRKTSQTRVNVTYSTELGAAAGVATAGNLVTSYGYDALGNLTRTTDVATNANVYSYYDALGRVTAVAAPTVNSTITGTALTPLTVFKRDAYGNVVVKLDMANSVIGATEFTGVSTSSAPGYTAGALDSSKDHQTRTRYDTSGHALQVTDANGVSHFTSYNASGLVAKKWQAITDIDNAVRTQFQVFQYDKLGRISETWDPAPLTASATTQSSAGLVKTALEYNAFGEVTRKGTDGKRQDYFDYDNAGHLWRTNNGDGIDKVFLYDLAGRQTAEIRSGSNQAVSGFTSPSQVVALTGTVRTNYTYDLLGHQVKKTLPTRVDQMETLDEPSIPTMSPIDIATPIDQNQPGDLFKFTLPGFVAQFGNKVVVTAEANYTMQPNAIMDVWLKQDGTLYKTEPVDLDKWGRLPNNAGELHVLRVQSGNSKIEGIFIRGNTTGTSAIDRNTYDLDKFRKDLVIPMVADKVWAPSASVSIGDIVKSPDGFLYRVTLGGTLGDLPPTPDYSTYTGVLDFPSVNGTARVEYVGAAEYAGAWKMAQHGGIRWYFTNIAAGQLADQLPLQDSIKEYLLMEIKNIVRDWAPNRSIQTGMRVGGANTQGIIWVCTDAGNGYTGMAPAFQSAPIGTVVKEPGSNVTWRATGYVGNKDWAPGVVVKKDDCVGGASTQGTVWQCIDAGTGITASTSSFPANAQYEISGPNNSATVYTDANGVQWKAIDQIKYPQWFLTDSNAEMTMDRPADSHDSYAATLIWAIDKYVSATHDTSILTAQSVHQGYTVAQVLKEVLYYNITTQFVDYDPTPEVYKLLTKTFQNDARPNGGFYATRYLMDNCEVYAGLDAAERLFRSLEDTSYADDLIAFRDANLRGIESLWQTDTDAIGIGYRWEAGADMSKAVYNDQISIAASDQTSFYPMVNSQYWMRLWKVPVNTTQRDEAETAADAHFTNWWLRADIDDLASTAALYAKFGDGKDNIKLRNALDVIEQKMLRKPQVGTIAPPEFIANDAAYYLALKNIAPAAASVQITPAINQKFDRWGNVLEVSDPRKDTWITKFSYNANNQLVRQVQPNAIGAQSADSPVTEIFYDENGHQIAVKDALNHINTQKYDQAGHLVKEVHADGGIVTYTYDAFGDRVGMVDAVGNAAATGSQTRVEHTTQYAYDKLDHLTTTTHGPVAVWGMSTAMALIGSTNQSIIESYKYDEAGRKIWQTNGAGETTKYKYDMRGNVVETRLPMGQSTKSVYDFQGHKLSETDANGKSNTWTYNDYGQLRYHTDLDSKQYTYNYDLAGHLTSQTSGHGQSLVYEYDAAGHITQITDTNLSKTTQYAWDAAGNRIQEKTTQDKQVYQDNHMAYDALGRLSWASDSYSYTTDYQVKNPRWTSYNGEPEFVTYVLTSHINTYVNFEYDKVGNRTSVKTHAYTTNVSNDPANPVTTSTKAVNDSWFFYDAMNRQKKVNAIDANGLLGAKSHELQYDLNGNRTEDYFFGNKIYSFPGYPYYTGAAYVFENYSYDGLNRMTGVTRDGVKVDTRYYDGAGRVVQSGPENLDPGYVTALNANVAQGKVIGLETKRTRFDSNGRMTYQSVTKSDGTAKFDLNYQNSYDAAGNVSHYQFINHDGSSYTDTYQTVFVLFDGYKEFGTSVSNSSHSATTASTYDVNGYLIRVNDSSQPGSDRLIVNDAAGRALFVNQSGNKLHQLVVNGEVFGRFGIGLNEVKPRNDDGSPNFAEVADFGFGFQQISAGYPSGQVGTYTVQSGDTLRSIALAAYGDEQLWYRIAEANGVGSDRELRVGQALNIPSGVESGRNTASTFQAYDPSKVVGDTSPNIPAPSRDDGCGVLAAIIITVVVVAVAAYTQNWYLMEYANGATLAEATAGEAITAGAIGGAAGAAAGQVVGNALGVYDRFDWSAVAAGAIGGAVTAGVGNGIGETGSAAVKAAVSNAISQHVNVVLGLQKSYSWQAVAAAAVGAGVGEEIGGDSLSAQQAEPIRPALFADYGLAGAIARNFLSGTATQATMSVFDGGHFNLKNVAADAFGNALGSAIKEEMLADPLGDFINKQVDLQQKRDLYGFGGNQATGLIIDKSVSYAWGKQIERNIQNASQAATDTALTEVQKIAFSNGLGPASEKYAQEWVADLRSPQPIGDKSTMLGNGVIRITTKDGKEKYIIREVSDQKLPPVVDVYQPMIGFFQGRYYAAVQGLQDPGATFFDKAYYTLAGAASLPLAILESPFTGLYNAPNNASLAGQFLAKSNLSNNSYDATVAKLSAVIYFADAANGLMGGTLVAPSVSGFRAAIRTPEEIAISNFPGLKVMNDNIWSNRHVMIGHGGLPPETMIVPRGTSITFYAEPGAAISNSLGKEIEVGTVSSRLYNRKYMPGELAPNPNLGPIKDSWVSADIKGFGIRVDSPTPLSDLLRPNMGDCHWAACLSNKNLPGYQYTYTPIGAIKDK